MPELPEVETLKLGLQKYLVGHKIEDVEVRVGKIFQGNPKDAIGAKVTGIKRVGKGLIIELDNDFDLAVHLKLTGQLIYRGSETKNVVVSEKTGGALPSKYTHVIFTLDKGAMLYYNDLRKFGWIKVIKKSEVSDLPFFKDMGPEPYRNPDLGQKTLTLSDFQAIVAKSGLPIKILLMDQKKIGGIGNIYANEALFKAGIDPRRKAKGLSEKEIRRLYKEIFEVIEKAIDFGGSSDVNFINALGQEGNYQEHFLVYGKENQKCSVCGSVIKKIFLGGRGTYFCPKHQR
jgi:formamidopyrimidine-DNA glycosylase